MFKSYMTSIIAVVFAVIVFTGLGWVLSVGGKRVERMVMVNSHQYIEGQNQQIAIFRANLTSVDSLLVVEKDPEVRKRLMAQKMSIQAQLQAAMQ